MYAVENAARQKSDRNPHELDPSLLCIDVVEMLESLLDGIYIFFSSALYCPARVVAVVALV